MSPLERQKAKYDAMVLDAVRQAKKILDENPRVQVARNIRRLLELEKKQDNDPLLRDP